MKTLRIFLYLLCLMIGPVGTAFSQSFSDGFEGNALDPFWSVYDLQNGQFSLSSEQVHSGSQSLKLNAIPTGGQVSVYLTHNFGQFVQGTVSVWFYDAYSSGYPYSYLGMGDATNDVLTVSNLGVEDWDHTYYHAGVIGGALPNNGQTTILRSQGWHKFEATFSSTGASIFIDDTLANSSTYDGGFGIISLSLSGPGVSGTYYFDDFNINAVPEPETYALLLAGLGVLGFVARRRKQHPA